MKVTRHNITFEIHTDWEGRMTFELAATNGEGNGAVLEAVAAVAAERDYNCVDHDEVTGGGCYCHCVKCIKSASIEIAEGMIFKPFKTYEPELECFNGGDWCAQAK